MTAFSRKIDGAQASRWYHQPEESWRQVNWRTHQSEPGRSKLRLETEPPCRPLRRHPGGREHAREYDGDLTPEDFGCGQVLPPQMIWGT
jgi:hypothetical protein